MQSNFLFDNLIIADDFDTVQLWIQQTWDIKHSIEMAANSPYFRGIFNSFLELLKDKPWLWSIIVIFVLLLNFVIYIFCCKKKDRASIQKKMDEVPPDDK